MRRTRAVALAAPAVTLTVAVSLWISHPRAQFSESRYQVTQSAQCRGLAGANDQARHVRGPVEYIDHDLTIKNTVFYGRHDDDLVRVYGGRVVFIDVTFRGKGVSPTGHSLEVKRGGSVEVINSRWAGAPAEDSVQFAEHKDSLVMCSVFDSNPGEDHVDVKPSEGAVLDILGNDFVTAAPGAGVQNKGAGGTQNFVDNTVPGDNVFYEAGTGTVERNTIARLDIYGAHDLLVVGNRIDRIKHGEWGTRRLPDNITYNQNHVGEFEFHGGSCIAAGNTGAADFRVCDN